MNKPQRLAASAALLPWFVFCFVVVLVIAVVDEAEIAWEKLIG